jgi:3-oxoacyl-(acyl-carrier-protein) synthase
MNDWGSRNRDREVVVTGAGVLCHFGDDLPTIESMLRAGCNTPFTLYAPGVAMKSRCQIAGQYQGDLADAELGVTKSQGRFLGRQSRLALAAARRALAHSGLERRDVAVVVGSGAGDVETHVEIQAKLESSGSMRRVLPTVVPRLMASTVSANLVNVLQTTGPSFTTSAACAGGAYNLLLAAMLIESGHTDAAVAGGCEMCDPHFHAGFDSMRAYNDEDNERPGRASRPYAADRAGFIFSEAPASPSSRRVRPPKRAAPRSSAACAAGGCRATARATWWRRRPTAHGGRWRWRCVTPGSPRPTSTT